MFSIIRLLFESFLFEIVHLNNGIFYTFSNLIQCLLVLNFLFKKQL